MRLKLLLLFLLTVLIPTLFLVYFSLLAVQGEKEILETNMKQKYQAIARIVLADFYMNLKQVPDPLRADAKTVEALLLGNAQLFKDEVMVFTKDGRALDGSPKETFGRPAYTAPVGDLPYEIAVYERFPILIGQFAAIQKRIARHIATVSLSATAILFGGIFTLSHLLKEWEKTAVKGEFISHLAHDLKRPLTSVRMFSEMLEMGRVPNEEKRKEYYHILSAESEKLIHLIHNVLDFSRIEGKRKRYDLKHEDLASVVEGTVGRFQTYVENNTHRIVLDVQDRPPSIKMDAEAMSQALMNLLFNATKYSPPGSEIRVVLARHGRKAVVSVVDQGIGVSKKEQKKIFREYYRSDDPEVRNREGTGLGLALVMDAVLAHKGKVLVKSEAGRGSEFRMELPI